MGSEGVMAVGLAIVAVSIAVACAPMRSSKHNVLTLSNLVFNEATLTDERYDAWFRTNCGCNQRTFRKLCRILTPLMTRTDLFNAREHIFEKKVAATLYFLRGTGCYREKAQAMGMSKSWMIEVVDAILDAIVLLSPSVIKLPDSEQEWERVGN